MRYKATALLLALSATWALPAKAVILQVDYTAVIGLTTGNGFGYGAGNVFTSQFYIDTDAVQSTQYCNVVPGQYQSCEYHGESLVAGGQAAGSLDHVFVSDQLKPACFQCESEFEDFHVFNGWSVDSPDGKRTFSSQWIRAFDAEIDFIHGSSLIQDFEFVSSAMSYYGNMYGVMYEFQRNPETGEEFYSNTARFAVTWLRVRPVTVPEPGTLELLGLGMAATGWIARRRRRRT